jgi:anaerobic selenocysteine-containing dehydrogenase
MVTFRNPPTGADGQHATFCRLCESFCGLIVTVANGEAVSVGPDRENPHSLGHVCVKGIGIRDVTYDPDRVITPLKRIGGPGEFEPVRWEQALDDIAERLRTIRDEHGGDSIASYLGNPTAFSTNGMGGFTQFMKAIGSQKPYGAGSQDSNARLTANYMLYGSPDVFPMADITQCDFLLIIGANTLVSNGWMLFAPRARHDFDAIAQRGRVVVVDPRRTETAQRYEHLPIKADTDIWLLLGMLRVLVDETLIDEDAIDLIAVGWKTMRRHVLTVSLPEASRRCGIEIETIQNLARSFSGTDRAAIYGGLGVARGRFGTLASYLLSTINVVTGKYGKPGGIIFGREALAGASCASVGGYADSKTRIGGVPTIANFMATAMLPADIEEEGEGRVRALIVNAGNPVLSGPGGERLKRALQKLELMVSFDIYQTESNCYAHYILPGTTFLERADWPFGLVHLQRPFLQYTDAVVTPRGEVRQEYSVYRSLARRMGIDLLAPVPETGQADEGHSLDPIGEMDRAVRLGPIGDVLGPEKGWSLERLRDHPHGVMIDEMPYGHIDWQKRLAYPNKKICLWHSLVPSEFERFEEARRETSAPLRLIGRRDIRSINSWMHNLDKLVRSQDPVLLINPKDATLYKIETGDRVRISTEQGAVIVPAEVSDEIIAGTISYPHGWGHAGGWQRANRTNGVNINVLLGMDMASVEFVSGMTFIDCLDVQLCKVD